MLARTIVRQLSYYLSILKLYIPLVCSTVVKYHCNNFLCYQIL